jgi:hypothetical protein
MRTVVGADHALRQFTELMNETLSWIQRNEPGTLQMELFRLNESPEGSDGTRVSLVERSVDA